MVDVQVAIATGPDEFSDVEVRLLSDEMRQQRVRGDVERHSEKHISAALIELARKLLVGDVELEESVARRQAHAGYIANIPRRHDEAPRMGIPADLLDDQR